MITLIIILSTVVWFSGALLMRFFMEIPTHQPDPPLGWKLLLSAFWPIVVPIWFSYALVNNMLYNRRIKKLEKARRR